jgi:hypothetical protein
MAKEAAEAELDEYLKVSPVLHELRGSVGAYCDS